VTNPSLIILLAAAVGLIVNTMAVLGVAWKGGHVLGRMEESVGRLSEEIHTLREARHDHANVLARVVANLDDIERRVERLEGK